MINMLDKKTRKTVESLSTGVGATVIQTQRQDRMALNKEHKIAKSYSHRNYRGGED